MKGEVLEHRPKVFPSKDQAMEHAMIYYLEHTAFVHPSRGGFILVWWNEGMQSMVGAMGGGYCCTLPDW